jgi:hypothetical protein
VQCGRDSIQPIDSLWVGITAEATETTGSTWPIQDILAEHDGASEWRGLNLSILRPGRYHSVCEDSLTYAAVRLTI